MINRYYKAVNELQEKIRVTQHDAMEAAASMCAEAVANGHSIHLYDTGHIIDSEMLNRAGGFELVKKFKFNLTLDQGNQPARVQEEHEQTKDRSQEGISAYALRASNVYPGDVMFIGSVSGNSFAVVDLAVEAKKMGVKIIDITSL